MSPDSTHNGVLVSAERERLGRALAEEFPREADVVTYVPRCPKHAAIGYAKTTGQESKFLDVFYKKKTTRVFMESTQGKRENEMEEMHMFPHVDVEGKDVVVIDDSIIRGTEAERAVRLLREAGARKIYFMSYTPPIGKEINGIKYGCVDGVDIPPEPPEEWNYAVRKWGSVEGVRNHLRVNELCYLSIDGMLKALNETATTTCTTCMSGWPKPSTYEHNLVQVTPSSYARR